MKNQTLNLYRISYRIICEIQNISPAFHRDALKDRHHRKNNIIKSRDAMIGTVMLVSALIA